MGGQWHRTSRIHISLLKLNNSKLAYRIYVILIANKELIKNKKGGNNKHELGTVFFLY
jgi:hypothetical protein